MTANEYEAVDSSQSVTLTVGWRSGSKIRLGRVPLTEAVADAFREGVAAVSTNLGEREPEEWTPDADLSPETYLVAERSALGASPLLADLPFEAESLFDALMGAADLEVLHPGELPAADLAFYAVTVGDEPDDLTVFLRRSNPRRGLRRGKWFTSYGDALAKIEEPIFSFDDDTDLIFQGDAVFVLSQTAFAMLFRSNAELSAQVPRWVDDLKAHVPMSKKGVKRLQDRVLRDSRLKRRLEAIVTRGHLQDVSAEKLRAEMEALDLDPDALLDSKGRLTMADEDIPEVLQFLNEDLFYGALTNAGFRADKKAAR